MQNLAQKHLFYKQIVVRACNGCCTAPLTDYINNRIYQESIDQSDYDGVRSDKRLYFHQRANASNTIQDEKLEKNDSKINPIKKGCNT